MMGSSDSPQSSVRRSMRLQQGTSSSGQENTQQNTTFAATPLNKRLYNAFLSSMVSQTPTSDREVTDIAPPDRVEEVVLACYLH
jgi:hypothetical protein